MNLKFAWELLNLTKSVRFSIKTNASLEVSPDDASAFGLYRNP
jgi:hypothetical protein